MAICSHHMDLSNKTLRIVTKALRNIREFGDAALFRSRERPLTCFRFRVLSALGHGTQVVESTREIVSQVWGSDLRLAVRSLLVDLVSILLEAQRFDEVEAVAKEAICGHSSLGYLEIYDNIRVAYYVLQNALGRVRKER